MSNKQKSIKIQFHESLLFKKEKQWSSVLFLQTMKAHLKGMLKDKSKL